MRKKDSFPESILIIIVLMTTSTILLVISIRIPIMVVAMIEQQ